MEQEEYAIRQFYEWFWANADFGPAHGDVVLCMFDEYEKETGEILPDAITEGYR